MARRKTALEDHLERQVAELQAQLADERRAFMAAVGEIAKSYADAVGKFAPALPPVKDSVTFTTSSPGQYVDPVRIENAESNEIRKVLEEEVA